jgi:hypothetical protein
LKAKKTIDALPKSHPFEIRYSEVEKIDWESCRNVLDQREKEQILKKQGKQGSKNRSVF